jgi:hypothetical protein
MVWLVIRAFVSGLCLGVFSRGRLVLDEISTVDGEAWMLLKIQIIHLI